MSPRIQFGNKYIDLPRSRAVRIAIGLALIVGGLVGFLPILGFWMIPLGVVVLSVDLPMLRRVRRRIETWWARRRRGKRDGAGAKVATGSEPEDN